MPFVLVASLIKHPPFKGKGQRQRKWKRKGKGMRKRTRKGYCTEHELVIRTAKGDKISTKGRRQRQRQRHVYRTHLYSYPYA